ncbi:hypothetical protein OS493_001433 [Desmophyllum pertusum]|uniref:Uncharacterized protein n=1 Tax=Desmophyllum pertusum TaxID=174260 RepID=A0A9X0CZ54_9CNID|nr:hypothetical protein OS493_001433 [Desmophyllum pertusum]
MANQSDDSGIVKCGPLIDFEDDSQKETHTARHSTPIKYNVLEMTPCSPMHAAGRWKHSSLYREKGILACRHVAIGETVVIPPCSEVIVTAEFVEGEATDGAGVLEVTAHFQERNNLLVARALVHTNQHNVPLRLLNPSNSAQIVFKRSIAAVCEPVESVDQGGVVQRE